MNSTNLDAGYLGPMNLLKKILRAIVIPVIALLLVFEEWGWEPLAALFMRLARLPLWAWEERQIGRAHV